MCKLLRRLFVLALIAGAGCAIYTAVTSRRRPPEGDAPAWPPLDDAPPAPVAATTPTQTAGDEAGAGAGDPDPGSGQRWAEPVDGQCPEGYPIKGNAGSGIYHVPGGRFYERTIPERCYADEDDAVADGYRRSKA